MLITMLTETHLYSKLLIMAYKSAYEKSDLKTFFHIQYKNKKQN